MRGLGRQRPRCARIDYRAGRYRRRLCAPQKRIGDDTLQKQMQGRVVPESFTHGSSAQRMEALQRGLKSGNPAACNYAR